MLIRAEVFIEIDSDNENEAQFDVMWSLTELQLQPGLRLVKIRMPDSPEPDITGTINING